MHQRQEVATDAALVRVALKNFLRVVEIHRQFLAARVIAGAAEGAINPHLATRVRYRQLQAALGSGFFERGLRLQLIDIHISGSVHGTLGSDRILPAQT